MDVTRSETYDNIYLHGSFTVHNPNSIGVEVQSVSQVLITQYGGTITCKINGTGPDVSFAVTIPANGDLVCNFETGHDLDSSVLALDLSDTAAVVATNSALNGTSTSGGVDFVLDQTTGEDTINVRDDKGGPNWVALGSTDVTHTFEYTQTFDCSDITYTDGFGQKTIHNIAEIVETQQQATEDVTVNCTQRRGSLTLNKVVDWNDTVNPPSTPSFHFCLIGTGGTSDPSPSCQDTTGGSLTWSNLIPGTYQLDETVPAGWSTDLGSIADWDTIMFTIDPGENQDLGTVTNTYHPGSLQVAKTVSLDGADPSEAPENTFHICVSGPSYPDVQECKDITGGSSATWSNLLPGDYNVQETNQSSEWTVTYTGGQIHTVDTGEPETAEVVNTLKHGDLTIAKQFDWQGVGPDDQPESVNFFICIKGPSYPNGTEAGACKPVGKTTTYVSWTDLIPGDYNVGEYQPSGGATVDSLPAWHVTSTSSSVHVAAADDGDPAAATITNQYQLGTLDVTKVVHWGAQAPDTSQTFEICIAGPSYPAGNCKDADYDGGILSWSNLIPGNYSVAETSPGAEWGVSGSAVVVNAPAGSTGSTTITNTILEGDLNVVKTIDFNGAPVDDAQTFLVCITGPTYPLGTETGACLKIDKDHLVAAWSDLEVGDYTVVETFPDSDSAEWNTVVDGVAGVTGGATVGTGDEPAVINITNTLKLARIIVHKAYEFPGGNPDDSWQPVVTVNGITATPSDLNNWVAIEVPANQPIDVQELLPDGWRNIDILLGDTCNSETPEDIVDELIQQALSLIGLDVDLLAQELAGDTVTVAPGVDCDVTFTNEAIGTVEIVKNDNTAGGGTWNFELDGPGEDNDEQLSIAGSDTETRSPVPSGEYSVVETNAGAYSSIEECPQPNPNGEGVYTTLSTPFGTSIDAPGKVIRFEFTNTSCPVVLATGSLVIEKWNDVDGDGVRDANEDPIGGWEFTVTGPQYPGGQTFATIDDESDSNYGKVILSGIFAGFYQVHEEDPADWYVTGLIVDGVSKTPSTTTQAEVKDDSLSDTVDTVVEFGNRQTASVHVVKVVKDQVGHVGRGGWVFTLQGCGFFKTAQTDANGEITWSSLIPCQYVVREEQANQDGFTTSPSAQQSVTPGPGQTAVVTFTNQRVPETTPETPTNTPVPTATPPSPTVTPTNTVEPPTDTPTPVETAAGEKTPGPGNQATPIPPDTGSGYGPGEASSNLLLVLLGIAAVTAGAGFISLGRKRR